MPILDEPALRFELLRIVQLLPKSVRNDLASSKPEAAERGTRAAVEIMYQRLREFEVRAPDRKALDFSEMERW
jgi:hypothetical protein